MDEQRVYEVARELQLASKVILLYLQSLDAPLRSASSHIDAALAQQVRATRIVDIKREARQQSQRNRDQPRRDEYWMHEDGWSDRRRWIGPDPVTTAQAARAAEVSPATIRKWVTRGHLHPSAHDGRSNVFRLDDVLRARDGAAVRNRQPKSLHSSRDRDFRFHLPDRFRGVTSANLQDLVTAQEGAKNAGVAASTVRSWVHRGLLVPAGRRGRFPLFIRVDVIRVARRTPYRPRRRPPPIF
jgi:DNA-binding transcriptional MerR regulator